MKRTLLLLCVVAHAAFSQGSLLLVGGGGEDYNDWSDAPYRWLVTHARNARILVLHYSDTTDFFSEYLPWLGPCTVSNFAITSPVQANDSAVYRRILDHDGIFLRGGDQWQYVANWRGTLAEKAIREVYARGGVVGGTSAGEAILSEIVFDASLNSVSPRTALRNPLEAGITLSDDFLRLGSGYVADSHFFERGRLGRLPAFLAVYKQLKQREIVGVGVDCNTALAVSPDGVSEAMGSGTVTIIRLTPQTQTTVVPGEQLSMTNLAFDQLTAGARISLTSGEVYPSSSSSAYNATAFSTRTSVVILDGSNSSSEWAATSGSLMKLCAVLNQHSDAIGIIASPSRPAATNSIRSALASRGYTPVAIWINESLKNDPGVAAALDSCRGIVFAGNSPDSLAGFLDSTTRAGTAFNGRLKADVPILFLSDDVMLAGEQGIGQMYKHIYGAYYGYLTQIRGLGVITGMQVVPRLYEAADYIDNRASAVFWSMAKSHLPFGLLLDAGTHVVVERGTMHVYGATPAMLADARGAQWSDLPRFRDPGKLNPRQNGGIIGGAFHVLSHGDEYILCGTTDVCGGKPEKDSPSRFELMQNYPNPFNPSTMIGYKVQGVEVGDVRLAVYDLLGREVAVLVDGQKEPGEYSIAFDASKLASGIYYCRMTAGAFSSMTKMIVLR